MTTATTKNANMEMPESGATREPTHSPSSGAPVQMLRGTTPMAATSPTRWSRPFAAGSLPPSPPSPGAGVSRPGLRARQQVGALARLRGVVARVVDALGVLLEVLVVRRAARAGAGAGAAGAGRAAEAAEPETAELGGELVARLGVRGLGDALVLVEVGDGEVELEVGGAAGARRRALGGDDAHRHHHPAQDPVVLARVDLDARVLDGVFDLLLLLCREPRRQLSPGLDAEVARLGQRGVDVVEEPAHVDAAGDLDRVLVAGRRLPLVLRVREPLARVEPQRGERLVLLVALLLGLLIAGLELLEDRVGDHVVGALEGHEPLVPGGGEAGLEALAGAVEREVDLELRELLLALGLERPGDAQAERAVDPVGVLGVDPEREVELARLDVLVAVEGVGQQRVDVRVRARLAPPAAGRDEQREGAEQAQQEGTQKASHAAAS